MTFCASLHPNLPTVSPHHCSQLYSLRFNMKQKTFLTATKMRSHSLKLNNTNSSINDNGGAEPARVLLERLFTHSQKLEEEVSKDSHLPRDVQLVMNLEMLELGIQAVLIALKKKGENQQNAERMVLLEHNELNCARDQLKQREKEIAAAFAKQEKIQEQLKQANLNLISQASQIEDLKLQLKERDHDIVAAQSALLLKEEEMDKMRNELLKKSEKVAKTDSELKSQSQLITEANEVVKKQRIELQGLRKAIREKEEELEASITLRKHDEEKLKAAEANIERRTIGWLLAQDELDKLAYVAYKNMGGNNENLEDLRRVKKLLQDVRSELIFCQKSLVSSRERMEEQETLFGKQLTELEEQRESIISYMKILKDAQIEVESEKLKLRVSEARNKELEWDISREEELLEELQEQLKKERSCLQQVTEEKSFLEKELCSINAEFEDAQNFLQVKESELVEAKIEIQHLKSEQASLELMLEEKDLELFNAREKLKEINQEVTELKKHMISKEEHLIQATTLLKEKDEDVQTMQEELKDTKLKFVEAENVVEHILEITTELVNSIKDGDSNALKPSHKRGEELRHHSSEELTFDARILTKQLETELEITRETLRMKEMEIFAAQRALTIKDEELKSIVGRLDAKEKELMSMKEELVTDSQDLRELYALAQERIQDKSVGDLAIEKLQLEASQLQVEAATCALHKLAEMSRDLLHKTDIGHKAETDTITSQHTDDHFRVLEIENNAIYTEVKMEVARLSSLSEQLVKEAGIVSSAKQ